MSSLTPKSLELLRSFVSVFLILFSTKPQFFCQFTSRLPELIVALRSRIPVSDLLSFMPPFIDLSRVSFLPPYPPPQASIFSWIFLKGCLPPSLTGLSLFTPLPQRTQLISIFPPLRPSFSKVLVCRFPFSLLSSQLPLKTLRSLPFSSCRFAYVSNGLLSLILLYPTLCASPRSIPYRSFCFGYAISPSICPPIFPYPIRVSSSALASLTSFHSSSLPLDDL